MRWTNLALGPEPRIGRAVPMNLSILSLIPLPERIQEEVRAVEPPVSLVMAPGWFDSEIRETWPAFTTDRYLRADSQRHRLAARLLTHRRRQAALTIKGGGDPRSTPRPSPRPVQDHLGFERFRPHGRGRPGIRKGFPPRAVSAEPIETSVQRR